MPQQAQTLQLFQLQGKEVFYDDSIRSLSEKDTEVSFNYNIEKGKLPSGAKALCNISNFR